MSVRRGLASTGRVITNTIGCAVPAVMSSSKACGACSLSTTVCGVPG